MRIWLCLSLLACGARSPATPDATVDPAPVAGPVEEPAQVDPAPAEAAATACDPQEVSLEDEGACDGTFADWTEGDFFYVGLSDPDARFMCGRCEGCEDLAVGSAVRVHWGVQSVEIPEGSPATLSPMITRCETR